MEILKDIVTGLVCGITEFLPVSSSGHMVLLDNLLGMDISDFYRLLIQIGLLISVILVFYEDVIGIIRGVFEMFLTVFANFIVWIKKMKGDTEYTYFKVISTGYRKLAILMVIAAIPTVLLTLAGSEMAEFLRSKLYVTGIFWIITGLVLFIADQNLDGELRVKKVTYSGSIFIGIAQGISVLSGTSRIGLTITTGLVQGYNRKLAVKSAFLMSIPALICSICVQAGKVEEVVADAGSIIGAVVVIAAGYASIRFMTNFIKKKKYAGFAVYNILLGIIMIILHFNY